VVKGLPGKQYGNFWVGRPGQPWIGAHVAAWEFEHGEVPRGLWVLHRCDVMLCVNVRHLFLGTVLDNNADMMAKDRIAYGDRHWNAKLSERTILVIKSRLARGERQKDLAAEFGIASGTMSYIANGKSWRRVTLDFDPLAELASYDQWLASERAQHYR
jgi:hypothetical protein